MPGAVVGKGIATDHSMVPPIRARTQALSGSAYCSRRFAIVACWTLLVLRAGASFEDREGPRILGPGLAHARKAVVRLGETLVQRLDPGGELGKRRFDGDGAGVRVVFHVPLNPRLKGCSTPKRGKAEEKRKNAEQYLQNRLVPMSSRSITTRPCDITGIKDWLTLERIAFDWSRIAVPIKRADPLDLNSVDQIHAPAGSPQAIPTDRDLV